MVSVEVERAKIFAASITSKRLEMRDKLEHIQSQYGLISLFGAGHLSVAFLSIMDIADMFNCILDDNIHKKGMRMPVGNLEIVGSEELYNRNISVCLLSLNPQSQEKVIGNHQRYIKQGGKFASIFPGSKLDFEVVL